MDTRGQDVRQVDDEDDDMISMARSRCAVCAICDAKGSGLGDDDDERHSCYLERSFHRRLKSALCAGRKAA